MIRMMFTVYLSPMAIAYYYCQCMPMPLVMPVTVHAYICVGICSDDNVHVKVHAYEAVRADRETDGCTQP